jgi:trans-aconitate 2-methyltransferase
VSPSAVDAGRDWDASSYDRVSDPQYAWALEVLERLPLAGDETVLDAGCGSGRVTAMLLERLPRGRVIAVDSSESMVEHARRALGERATIFRADLTEFELDEPVDAVFSNAVFHWIPDHDRLFRRLFAALRPGGRLVAQCGGEGNVARLIEAMRRVYRRDAFAGTDRPPRGWVNFAAAQPTRAGLEAVGFTDVETSLEPKSAPVDREFLQTVSLSTDLARLPPERHDEFVDAVVEELGVPLELDWVRLNIDARRPA